MSSGSDRVARTTAVLMAAALACGNALAQSQYSVIPEQSERQTLSEDLIGQPVLARDPESGNREEIGSIDGLLLNENGRLTGVIVSIGGFLGFGARSVALDVDALEMEKFGETHFQAIVDMTPEELEGSPAFKTLAEKEAERLREQAPQQPQQPLVGAGTGGTPGGEAGGTVGAGTGLQ